MKILFASIFSFIILKVKTRDLFYNLYMLDSDTI